MAAVHIVADFSVGRRGNAVLIAGKRLIGKSQFVEQKERTRREEIFFLGGLFFGFCKPNLFAKDISRLRPRGTFVISDKSTQKRHLKPRFQNFLARTAPQAVARDHRPRGVAAAETSRNLNGSWVVSARPLPASVNKMQRSIALFACYIRANKPAVLFCGNVSG